MIFEILEWCLTPASWKARKSGFLSGQIAIRHRALRCAKEWRAHQQSSRDFIQKNSGSGALAVVLGSGHLHDIDLRSLQASFNRVVLVDAVHPLEVQFASMFKAGRIKLHVEDISGLAYGHHAGGETSPPESLQELVASADVAISTCLLSQLAITASNPEECLSIQSQHLDLIQSATRSVLVTDIAHRYHTALQWDFFVFKNLLPAPTESWVWDFAPEHEHGIKGRGLEQRLVQAFSLPK